MKRQSFLRACVMMGSMGSLLCSGLYGQNVGIGTNVPQNRLHIDGATPADANSGQLRISESTNGRYMLLGRAASYGFIQTHNSQPLAINPLGNNVGIGTTAPTERLHVAGNLRLDNAFMPGNNAGTAGSLLRSAGPGNAPVWIAPGANGSVLTISGGLPTWSSPNGLFWSLTGNSGTNPTTNFLGTTDAVDLVIRTNNTERVRVTSGGNVGIGITTPSQRLVVNGNIGLQAGAPAFVGTLDNNRMELRVNNQISLILNPPGTAAPAWSIQRDLGGNARGYASVDLQMQRQANTQVASGSSSVIAGGANNTASGVASVVVGGSYNAAIGDYSAVVGGFDCQSRGASAFSFIGGGSNNLIEPVTGHAEYSTICGGRQNLIRSMHCFIGGGFLNGIISNDPNLTQACAIAGGEWNRIVSNTSQSMFAAFIGGGSYNEISDGLGEYSSILGGHVNRISSSLSVVVGGWNNRIPDPDAHVSFIGGGGKNVIYSQYSFIGGGGLDPDSIPSAAYSNGNIVFDNYGVICGGASNHAGSNNADRNDAWFAFIGGGRRNRAQAASSVICGGAENITTGRFSSIVGGWDNTANGWYNLVFGQNVDPTVSETHRVYFFGNGSTSPSRPSGFLVINRLDGDHPIHVGTNNTNGNGAHLTVGGTWTNASTREKKDRFRALDAAEVLGKIRRLPVEGWYYKGTEEYHIGPYAEDFHAAFGTGVHEIIETDSTGNIVRRPNPEVSHYLAASDVAGVALIGVKALDERSTAQERHLAALESRIEALAQEVERLRSENQLLRARLDQLQTSTTVAEK